MIHLNNSNEVALYTLMVAVRVAAIVVLVGFHPDVGDLRRVRLSGESEVVVAG